MRRPKIEFLPAFFTVLAIVFAIALWVRLRSYSTMGPVEPSAQPQQQRQPGDQPVVFARTANATAAPTVESPQSRAASNTNASARETRRWATKKIDYTQLPPPPATSTINAPKPAEKPSLLSRIVKPIANAFSGNSTPSQPRPQQQASSSSQNLQTSASRSSGTSHNTETTGPAADPKDRSSDTQPPQLLMIMFNPPQVHDGEETVLTVQAVDDLSGIRSISGTIAAPSGAVQGFALQREQQSDQYVAHITVPKDAAEGVWKVNYLSLIDNASNATTMSGQQGALPATATFRVVSSRPDSAGPSLKAVWVDRQAMKAGEKNTIFVQADDDKSGVSLVSGVFISPQKHARIGFVCRQGSGQWECELSTPVCIDCGDWHLEQLQLQDKANNMSTVRQDNPLISNVFVNIAGDRCDSTPPNLQTLILDRPAVSNVEDSIVNVTASASDDQCGIMSMSGQVSGPTTGGGQPRLYFSFTASDAQNWTGRISVPKLAAKGVWRITWIQVLDQGHNLKTYSQGDPALVNAAFNVQ